MAERPAHHGQIRHLQAFRGFAILCVVALHAWGDQITYFGGVERSAGVGRFYVFNESLLHDGTTFFSLISGLLFPLALRARGWTTFFRNRMLHLVAPYVLVSTLFTFWNHFDRYQPTAPEGHLADYVAAILTNLWSGRAYYHLWYIPVIIALSLLTPMVAWLCDRPRWHWLLGLVILMPLVVSRTGIRVSWSSIGYFLGSYSVGVFVGSRYESALRAAQRHRLALWMVAGLSTLALLWLHRMGLDRMGFVSGRESAFYIQKLAIAALVIVWLREREDRMPQWLMTAGTFAFPIFFLHAFFLTLLARAQMSLGIQPSGVAGMLAGGALSIVVSMGGAVLIGQLARRVFGKHSRSLIGA